MTALTETLQTALLVARRELSSRFRSPVALVFLGVFLIAVNLGFFTLSGFFARGLADLRPLFESLPLLLLLLVAALTMGGWAEERKLGTLEVLLTLPVRPWGLVLGKWLAGLGMVALALALTWPLPALVASLGPLDPGPVIGGYLGALLVGGAWVAVGLCVSARTDNQIVALILTLVVGGALLLVGDNAFTSLFDGQIAEILNGLGAGSRFESIERGVIDLSDVLYYAAIILTALTLNTAFLDLPRIDRGSNPQRVGARWLHVALIATNAALLVLWIAPIPNLRLDLTADRLYSLAPVTQRTLRQLDEPLVIDAYLSGRTHPLLSPLVPRIRDTLDELRAVGGSRVRVTISDPSTDDDLAAHIGEKYGIDSVPFGVADRQAQSVVNAYFHILVRYGDQHEVLGVGDLIEVDTAMAGSEVDVRLSDLEYGLMKAIRKVSRSFQSLDAQLARLPEGTTATLYATPDTAPPEFADGIAHLRTIGAELADRSGGKLTFTEVAPTRDQVEELYEEAGVRPLAADVFGQELFYAHLMLNAGDKAQRILPGADATEGDVRRSLESAIRRASPGQLVRVGLLTGTPEAPPPNPQIPQQFQPPPPRPDYQGIQRQLAQTHEVEQVDLTEGAIPDHLDVLVIGKAGPLSPEQKWAIDQYLMRGGAVVALAGSYAIDLQARGGLSVKKSDADLRELVASWGLEIGDTLVLDPQNVPFPMPVVEQRGAYRMQRVQLVPYPFFPDVRGAGLAAGHPAVAGLSSLTVPWASPVRPASDLPEDVQAEVVLRSSAGAWTSDDGTIAPDFTEWPDEGFGKPDGAQTAAEPLAVVVTGPMSSHFADKPSPVWSAQAEGADPTGRTMKTAAPSARLAVVGSSELVSDVLLQLAESPSGEPHRGNLQLFQNLLDWSVEDTDLLEIRSAGAFARTLPHSDRSAHSTWELLAYAGALFPLLLLGGLPRFIGRRLPPELARLDAPQGRTPSPRKEA